MALPLLPLLLLGGAALALTSKKPRKNKIKLLRKTDSQICLLGASDFTFDGFAKAMRPYEAWAEAGAKRGAGSLDITGIYLKMDEDLIESTCDWFGPPLGQTQDGTYVAPLQATILISADKLMAKVNDCSAARFPLTGLKDISGMVGAYAPTAPLDTESKILEQQAMLGLKLCEELMDPSTVGFMVQVSMPLVPPQELSSPPIPRLSLVKRDSNGSLTTEEFSIAEKLGIPTSTTPQNPAEPPSLLNLPMMPEGLNLKIIESDAQRNTIIGYADGPITQSSATPYLDQLSSLSSPPLTQLVAILTGSAEPIQKLLGDKENFVLMMFPLGNLSQSEIETAADMINAYASGPGTKTLVAERIEIGTPNEVVYYYVLDDNTLVLTPISKMPPEPEKAVPGDNEVTSPALQ
jgi:hypothetical protein